MKGQHVISFIFFTLKGDVILTSLLFIYISLNIFTLGLLLNYESHFINQNLCFSKSEFHLFLIYPIIWSV